MRIEERVVDGVSILDLTGNLRQGEGVELPLKRVKALVASGRNVLVLNMTDVSYIDATGVAELAWCLRTVLRNDGRLAYVSPTTRVRDFLAIRKIFEVYETEEEALSAVKRPSFWRWCPVCQGLNVSPLPLNWTCRSCRSIIEVAWPTSLKEEMACEAATVKIPTYADEWIVITSERPSVVEIVGRLDLFASEKLELAWRSLPSPRKVVFDLAQTQEISDAGLRSLCRLCASTGEESKAVVLARGKGAMTHSLPREPPFYSDRSSAEEALGDTESATAILVRAKAMTLR